MANTAMSLHEKLVELRKAVGCLVKDQEGYGYNYVTGNQILVKVKDKMNELGLLLVPSAGIGENYYTHNYTTAKGDSKTDFIVMGEMNYTWVNVDEPTEKLVIPWAYYGQQDDISKAFGSALTYSERYFWLKLLGLPTDEDDPDARNVQHKRLTSIKSTIQQSSLPQGEVARRPQKDINTGQYKSQNKTRYITEPQQKRLWAIAGGDQYIVRTVLAANGLRQESEIAMGKQYDDICEQAEAIVSSKREHAISVGGVK